MGQRRNLPPKGLDREGAIESLEKFLNRNLPPGDIASVIGPKWDLERGWHINIVLADEHYTDYFVYPNGTVTT